MITSKLTSKGQTIGRLSVRKALRLVAGDEIAYLIAGDRVVLSKASREPVDDAFATFSEWLSDADRIGYARL